MNSIFDSAAFNERLFFPRPDDSTPPEGAEDLALSVEPGVALHARWHHHPNGSPKAIFLIFHGNGEIVADYDGIAPRYHRDLGADLIVVDFRGYGQSQGVSTYRNCIADATEVARAVVARIERATGSAPRPPLIVLGRSLGGACTAAIAAATPPLADAVVMESAGADPRRLIARRGLPVPSELTAPETLAFDPRPKLAACTRPVLVLHGEADEIIDASEARANFAALTTPHKHLTLVPGHGHNDLWGASAYWLALRDFIAALPPQDVL